MAELGLIILLVLVIATAAASLLLSDLLASVIALGAAALCISATYLLLGASDLAVVQFAVEIVVLAMLIWATSRRDTARPNPRLAAVIPVTIAVVVAFGYFMYRSLGQVPPFGAPFMQSSGAYIEEGLGEGTALTVSEIMLRYRSLDIAGEAIIIFTALLGVLAVLRPVGRIRRK